VGLETTRRSNKLSNLLKNYSILNFQQNNLHVSSFSQGFAYSAHLAMLRPFGAFMAREACLKNPLIEQPLHQTTETCGMDEFW